MIPTERAEVRTIVIDELDRMSRMVNDLLLLARAERPDFLRLAEVDIGACTGEVQAKASDARRPPTGSTAAERRSLSSLIASGSRKRGCNSPRTPSQHTAFRRHDRTRLPPRWRHVGALGR